MTKDQNEWQAFANQSSTLGPWKPISLNMLYTDSLNIIAACKRNPSFCDVAISWATESAHHAETEHEVEIYALTIDSIQKVKENMQ